jgi:glycosyltransferase involved in cell wall biosynthesis
MTQFPILALIPAYNEAVHIGQVVTQVGNFLPVLVVDDGSKDDTAGQAEAAGAMVLRQMPNQGKGAALKAGFTWAIEQGYAAVVTLDADGQHDPAELSKFLELYQTTQADLIIGARDFSQMPLVRRVSNTIGRWLFSWALGQPVQDNQSGYRLISRRLLQAMLTSQEHGFQFEVEMIVVCAKQRFKLDWLPIRTIYADETSHINPGQHVLEFMRITWQTRRRMQSP